MGDFPHPLLILYQIRHVMSSFFSFFFSFILLEIFQLWTSGLIPFSFLFFHDDTLFIDLRYAYDNLTHSSRFSCSLLLIFR